MDDKVRCPNCNACSCGFCENFRSNGTKASKVSKKAKQVTAAASSSTTTSAAALTSTLSENGREKNFTSGEILRIGLILLSSHCTDLTAKLFNRLNKSDLDAGVTSKKIWSDVANIYNDKNVIVEDGFLLQLNSGLFSIISLTADSNKIVHDTNRVYPRSSVSIERQFKKIRGEYELRCSRFERSGNNDSDFADFVQDPDTTFGRALICWHSMCNLNQGFSFLRRCVDSSLVAELGGQSPTLPQRKKQNEDLHHLLTPLNFFYFKKGIQQVQK
jgi:hypothetical protein